MSPTIPFLAVRGDAAALRQLDERHAALLAHHGLASWTRRALEDAGMSGSPLRAALAPAAEREFARCCARKLALTRLDARAAELGMTILVLKGGASSLAFYPSEELRPSCDLDALLSAEDLAKLLPQTRLDWLIGPHAPIDQSLGYPLEAHLSFRAGRGWGTPRDLSEGSVTLEQFPHLRRCGAVVSLTVALLHAVANRGKAPFDALDAKLIVASPGFDLEEAVAYWRERHITQLAWPALHAFSPWVPAFDAKLLSRVLQDLPTSTRRRCQLNSRLMRGESFSRLKRCWLKSQLRGISFARQLLESFLGRQAITAQLTGLSPRRPSFWWQHLVRQPLRRLGNLFK